MTTLLFSNQAQTTLAQPVGLTDTTIYVASGTGQYFPNPSVNQGFKLTLVSAANSFVTEITLVTAVNGDEFTVLRAQEGTTAKQWAIGDFAANLMTAETLNGFVQAAQLEDGSFSPVFDNVEMLTGQVLSAPVNPTDVVNKDYVDSQVGGVYFAGTGLNLVSKVFSIANTGVTADTYGSASNVPVVAVNAQGQITAVTNTPIQINAGQITGLGTMATQNANAVSITGGTINDVAVTGGTIDNTVIGDTDPAAGYFTNLIAADAYITNGSAYFSNLSTPNVEITGGTIDNTPIGSTTPAVVTATVYNNMSGGTF